MGRACWSFEGFDMNKEELRDLIKVEIEILAALNREVASNIHKLSKM
jgi:hypothetical protein